MNSALFTFHLCRRQGEQAERRCSGGIENWIQDYGNPMVEWKAARIIRIKMAVGISDRFCILLSEADQQRKRTFVFHKMEVAHTFEWRIRRCFNHDYIRKPPKKKSWQDQKSCTDAVNARPSCVRSLSEWMQCRKRYWSACGNGREKEELHARSPHHLWSNDDLRQKINRGSADPYLKENICLPLLRWLK